MPDIKQIEIPFSWTCPTCQHRQTDTVNPELGPFLTVVCGECGSVHDDDSMTPVDSDAWEVARGAAEASND